MKNTANALEIKKTHPPIMGWGADLKREQRPGIPRELNHENVLSPNHHRPIRSKQKPGANVNLTIERDQYTPVLGNSVSPDVVSGLIRRLAFKFSEDSLRHWLLLLAADRVNMVEGWFEDLGKGRVPMILPRFEFRTTDHLRRIWQQGAKSKQDKALLASVALLSVGLGVAAYLVAKKRLRDY